MAEIPSLSRRLFPGFIKRVGEKFALVALADEENHFSQGCGHPDRRTSNRKYYLGVASKEATFAAYRKIIDV